MPKKAFIRHPLSGSVASGNRKTAKRWIMQEGWTRKGGRKAVRRASGKRKKRGR